MKTEAEKYVVCDRPGFFSGMNLNDDCGTNE